MDKHTPMEEVFDHYFQTYYTKLWRQAQSILARHTGRKDPDRAAEAVQEVFLVAWKKPREFLGSPSPVGWLVNTLKFVLQNMLREDQRWHARLQEFQAHLDRDAVHPAPGADLEIEGLIPPEELDLLKRLYLYGETYEELCRELGPLPGQTHRPRKHPHLCTGEIGPSREFYVIHTRVTSGDRGTVLPWGVSKVGPADICC